MISAGQLIKDNREKKGLLLRHVAAKLDIDQAILSKIEKGDRKPNKALVIKLSKILDLDPEDLLVHFLSEKIAEELSMESCAVRALRVAEKKIRYIRLKENNDK